MPHNTDIIDWKEATCLTIKGTIQYTALGIASLAVVYLTLGFGTWIPL